MGLIALYDKLGTPSAFKVQDEDRILALSGADVAWIQFGSVYNAQGGHIGWWDENCLRGHDGGIMLFAEGGPMGWPAPKLYKFFSFPVAGPPPGRGFAQVPPDLPFFTSHWSSSLFGVW
jgi:hypothetical protein